VEAAYKKLFSWQVADELVNKVYDAAIGLPKEEQFGLTSQLKRAALSVPANIIEGHARNSKNEFRHFLSIALGSLAEVEYYLEFALRRKFIDQEQFNEIETLREKCGKMLWNLYKSQSSNK
jgi:four helix bundle protein